jgi:hypothetical protein
LAHAASRKRLLRLDETKPRHGFAQMLAPWVDKSRSYRLQVQVEKIFHGGKFF